MNDIIYSYLADGNLIVRMRDGTETSFGKFIAYGSGGSGTGPKGDKGDPGLPGLSQLTSPFKYGGQGQGGDDTNAINDAITATGNVYLDPNYVWGVRSNAIAMLRGQTIIGAGCGIYGYAMSPLCLSTLKLLPGQPSGTMITMPDFENGQRICDVYFDATAVAAGNSPVINIVDTATPQEARQRFERVVIVGGGLVASQGGLGGDGLYIGSGRRAVKTVDVQSSLHALSGIKVVGSDSEHYNVGISGCSDPNGGFVANGTTRLFGYNIYNNRTSGLFITSNSQCFVGSSGSSDGNDKHGVYIATGCVDVSFHGLRVHDNGLLTNAAYSDVSVNSYSRFYGGGAQQTGAGTKKVLCNFQVASGIFPDIEGFEFSPLSQITGVSAVLYTGGGANRKITVATTLKPGQYLAPVDATAGVIPITLPLPSQVAIGKVYRVAKIDASANAVTVNHATLLPAGAVSLPTQGSVKGFVSDTFNWMAA